MTRAKKRITKAPDERRRELIRAARMLFVQKGYEATTVSDIVRKIGAAQGTFYWYFGSKQDALLAVHREMMEEIMTLMKAIVIDESLTAVEKLRHVYEDVVARIEVDEALAEAVSIRVQPQVHELAVAEWGPEMLALFTSIIRQGTAEGTFQVKQPEMAAAFLVTLGEKIFDDAARGRGLWRVPEGREERASPAAAGPAQSGPAAPTTAPTQSGPAAPAAAPASSSRVPGALSTWAASEVTQALWEFALHGLGVARE